MTADKLHSLLASPHLIDLILVFTVVEAMVVIVSRGLSPTGTIRLLFPGVCLLLALRSALAQTVWPWVPAALGAALIGHLWDLRGRWRG